MCGEKESSVLGGCHASLAVFDFGRCCSSQCPRLGAIPFLNEAAGMTG
jgi:hypothetical protein